MSMQWRIDIVFWEAIFWMYIVSLLFSSNLQCIFLSYCALSNSASIFPLFLISASHLGGYFFMSYLNSTAIWSRVPSDISDLPQISLTSTSLFNDFCGDVTILKSLLMLSSLSFWPGTYSLSLYWDFWFEAFLAELLELNVSCLCRVCCLFMIDCLEITFNCGDKCSIIFYGFSWIVGGRS